MKVLFSVFGTTDPVRGERDGGFLHILRHYRPDRVDVLLTKEIEERNRKSLFLEKTMAYIKEHWGGYAPELVCHCTQIEDPSDLDAVEKPVMDAFQELLLQAPEAELLINISSGTPQMQLILMQLVTDLRFHAKGIQIKNPEKKSGSKERSNGKDYDVDLELEFNEDEQPGAENRCVEPELMNLHRQKRREQVATLMEHRQFEAVYAMRDELPAELAELAEHLALRSRLQYEDAKKLCRGISRELNLYPEKKLRDDAAETVEYYLMMRNLSLTGRYSDFVLRVNPFIVRLQQSRLETLLQKQGQPGLDAVASRNQWGVWEWDAEKVKTGMPELWAQLLEKLRGKELKNSPFFISCFLRCPRGIAAAVEAKNVPPARFFDVSTVQQALISSLFCVFLLTNTRKSLDFRVFCYENCTSQHILDTRN